MKNTMYTKNVMKHFMHPKHMGQIKNADAIGMVMNPTCEDSMKLYLKVEKNKKGEDIIKDIKFETMGCAAAIASSDMTCEVAKGKTIKDALKINNKMILKKLGGLPCIKEHCSMLGEEALHKAIENYLKKNKSNSENL